MSHCRNRPYVSSDMTDLRTLFASIDPNWNKRPDSLPERSAERNRMNGWDYVADAKQTQPVPITRKKA